MGRGGIKGVRNGQGRNWRIQDKFYCSCLFLSVFLSFCREMFFKMDVEGGKINGSDQRGKKRGGGNTDTGLL